MPHLAARDVLYGSTVFLRLPRREELSFVRALWGDPETMRPVGGPIDLSEAAAEAWFARMVEPGSPAHCYCLILTQEGVPVGEMSFHRWDPQTRSAELNFKVLASQRKQGYAKDALRTFLAFFFGHVGGQLLTDDVAPANLPGQRLLETFGFTRERLAPDVCPLVMTQAMYLERFGTPVQRKTVGIVLFPDVEVLDFAGPFEVFSVARLDEEKRREEPSPFRVILIAERNEPIVASGNLRVLPDYTLADCPKLDILCVPGGWGTRQQVHNPALLDWLRAQAAEVELLTSVCTGAMLLGFAGLLDGHRATTHWRSLDWMHDALHTVSVVREEHVVEDGSVMTSAGISAGIDLALKVVARYCGENVARATARHMEYPYPEENRRRV